jgi:hypothetical protein
MHSKPRLTALLAAALATTALTAPTLAETLTVTDITAEADGGYKLTVPTVEAVDANVDEAAIRAVFGPDFAGSIDALSGLTAASIRIPTISVSYDVPSASGGAPATATIVYHDFELSGVENGVAKSAMVGGMTMAGMEAGTAITLGAMSTSDLNIAGIFGFYGLVEGGSDEMQVIYRDFGLEGGSIAGDAFNCSLGAATTAEFSARPLQGTFTEMMKVTADLEAAERSATAPPPEAVAAIIRYYADLLTAFRTTPTTFEGFACSGTDPQGGSFALTSGPVEMGAYEPGIYPTIALDDFSFEAQDGWFRLGNFTWKPMDMNDAIENLVEGADQVDEAWFEKHWRFLIPAFEGFSLEGLAFDIPEQGRGPGARVAAEIASLDVTLGDYVNGIPSSITTHGDGIDIAVPDDGDGAALRAMGIERLSMDYGVDVRWDRETSTIAVERVAFAADELGSVTLSGTLANAGSELFSERNEVVMAAAMGLTATELTIEIENAGALALAIAAAAAEEGQQPQVFQIAMAGMAQAMPLAILGGTPEALKVSEALGAFMRGTPNLTLTLTSTDPKGIGLAELMAAEDDPTLLKDKVTITASASGEPVPFVWPEPPAEPAPQTSTEPAPEPVSPRAEEKSNTKN